MIGARQHQSKAKAKRSAIIPQPWAAKGKTVSRNSWKAELCMATRDFHMSLGFGRMKECKKA